MRYSKALIPTVKEVPAEAEIISHQLMLRAGLMRKLASGTYTYLPLGWRILTKVMNIVRDEMNSSGAQEILMPSVQPMELWAQTGRSVDYGKTMAHFTDRHGRENVLAPTAEEVVTSLAAGEINSYKQLPFNLYQISFKFRDEFRPRFGVLRSREFIMKDSYSFHADKESLGETYQQMYDAYCRIFARCGLEYVIVEAESGEMGGSGSHQFTVPCENGEDVIVYTAGNKYAANIEKADVDALPRAAENKDIAAMAEIHTPGAKTIEEVCKFLKAKPKKLIKTLIYKSDDKTIVALVSGDMEINEEKLRIIAGGSIEMANDDTIKKLTGADTGFAGPVGIAEKCDKLVIDHSVAAMAFGITGANKTDYHLAKVVPGRDFPLEGENVIVADIRNAVEGDTYQGKKLLFRRGIEVGQVFELGTKYSKKLGCKFLDADGKENPCLMGCYGIGINRIVASAIENGHDENGIIWPINIAPFEVIITPAGNDENIINASETIYKQLTDMGIEVLLDDRDIRGGVKFKDADLIGIPLRITIGKKSIAENCVEIKLRSSKDIEKVPVENAATKANEIIQSLKVK
ncbi:MAG: proline--tRNA ligase [Anaerohalosphaeraceae bacterium]|nr:proline--tRNA ligase [Anaerohalosphaeraceae bacterium]